MVTDGARRLGKLSGLVVAASIVLAGGAAHADETAAPAPEPAAPSPPAQPEAAPAAATDGPDTVTVRGNVADTLERSTGSGSRVSETEIKRAQPQSTSEVFRRVPGLVVRQEDGMGLRLNLGVRGLNPTRSRLVLIQEDGVPVVVSPYGEPELYYSTPIERVQRLDVLKGHEVLRYGPQTVGGVVNLYTWAPPTREEWSVEADYGQRSFARGLVRYGNAVGDVRYVVQAFHKQGDGFQNMGFDVTDVMGKVAFPTGKNGEATLKISAYDEVSHTTYVGLTNSMYKADPRQNTVAPDDLFGIRRYEVSLQHEQHLTPLTTLRTTAFAYMVDMRIYQQDFDRKFDREAVLPPDQYQRILGDTRADDAGLYFRNTRSLRDRSYNVAGVEPQLEQRFDTGSVNHRLIVGGRAMIDSARRKLSNGTTPTAETGDLQTDDTTTILGLAAYAEDRMAFLENMLVTPSFRVEHAISRRNSRRILNDVGLPQDVDLSGTSSTTGVMPGVGFAYGKPVFNVFWGVHSGYSPPRVSQSITPTGKDAGLDAERSMNYELGTRARPFRWFRGEVTGFLTNFDNQLISNNTLSGSTAEFKNGGKTRHVGAEVTALTHFGVRDGLPLELDLAAQYTYVRSTFSDGPNQGNFVPYAPENTLTVTLDGDHSSGLGGQVSFSYVGSQFADEQNTLEPDVSGRAGQIPAYKILDLGARYRHKPTGISFLLTVKNAFDDVYLSSRLPNGIFTAGYRQAMVGLKWSGP